MFRFQEKCFKIIRFDSALCNILAISVIRVENNQYISSSRFEVNGRVAFVIRWLNKNDKVYKSHNFHFFIISSFGIMERINPRHLDDKMLHTLTCRHCKFYLNVSPIMTFDDGRSICGRCYKEEDYTDDNRPVRNKLYETLSQYVPFPCKYRNVGCKQRLAENALVVHENKCLYGPCTCPVSACNWNGLLQYLQQHYETDHPNLCLKNRTISLDVNQDFEENNLVIDNEIFIVQVKCETSSGKLWCAAVSVSPSVCSASYNLELEFIHSEKVNSSIICKTPVSNDLQPINKNEALQIDISLLKKFLNNTEDLKAIISFTGANNKNLLVESTLLKQFECPVCKHYMVSPIFICSNGHSICNFCNSQMNTCPICRVNLNNVHNYALESIIEQINYPCKYSINGCRYISSANEIEAHEIDCVLQAEMAPGFSFLQI